LSIDEPPVARNRLQQISDTCRGHDVSSQSHYITALLPKEEKNMDQKYKIKPRSIGRRPGLKQLNLIVILIALSLSLSACAIGPGSVTGSQATTTRMPDPTSATTSAGTDQTDTDATTTAAAIRALIRPTEASQMLADDPRAILLDVRTEAEFKSGHIPGALLIPVEELSGRLGELPEDRTTPIIVYCRTGRRSSLAVDILAEAGYRLLYDLGGILDWPYETQAG
jgi:rhodanese-related sulfurtransferase